MTNKSSLSAEIKAKAEQIANSYKFTDAGTTHYEACIAMAIWMQSQFKETEKPEDVEKLAEEYGDSFKTGNWFSKIRQEAFIAGYNAATGTK